MVHNFAYFGAFVHLDATTYCTVYNMHHRRHHYINKQRPTASESFMHEQSSQWNELKEKIEQFVRAKKKNGEEEEERKNTQLTRCFVCLFHAFVLALPVSPLNLTVTCCFFLMQYTGTTCCRRTRLSHGQQSVRLITIE